MATERPCAVDGCDRPVLARGWCNAHYKRWSLYGDPTGSRERARRERPTCTADGCDRPNHAFGMCSLHYARHLKAVRPDCRVDGCDRPTWARGLCNAHYQRLRKYGDAGVDPVKNVGCALCFDPLVDVYEHILRSSTSGRKAIADAIGVNDNVVANHARYHMDNPEHASKLACHAAARLLAARTRMEQTA